eukprot:COSAG01_NODE_1017_length_12107_cov_114.566372_6_plen_77_part_00
MRARGRGRVQMVPRAAAAACAECEVAWLMASRAWRCWARVAVPRRKVRCCGRPYSEISTEDGMIRNVGESQPLLGF